MSIIRQGPDKRPPELPARLVATVGTGPNQVTVEASSDMAAMGRIMIGGQQLAAPGHVLRSLYAVLDGIYGLGPLI